MEIAILIVPPDVCNYARDVTPLAAGDLVPWALPVEGSPGGKSSRAQSSTWGMKLPVGGDK